MSIVFGAFLAVASTFSVIRKMFSGVPVSRRLDVDEDTITLMLFGLACLTVHYYGQEMWYWPFASTGLAFVGLAAVPILLRIPWLSRIARSTALFSLIAAVSLSSWTLALREEGFMHFSARPGVMQKLASERAAVISDVRSYLVRSGAHRTLVSPLIYEEMQEPSNEMQIFTTNPFSRHDGRHFDAYVGVSRHFPVHLSEPGGLHAVSTDQGCDRVQQFSSPRGTYKLTVARFTTDSSDSKAPCDVEVDW
jgi:hypothetical protein